MVGGMQVSLSSHITSRGNWFEFVLEADLLLKSSSASPFSSYDGTMK
jgi:hypothetical protein